LFSFSVKNVLPPYIIAKGKIMPYIFLITKYLLYFEIID